MSKISSVEPCGKMVLLKFCKVEEKEEMFVKGPSGILLPNGTVAGGAGPQQAQKSKFYAVVDKIGPDIKPEEITFKVGDRVFYNDYDCKAFGDDDTTYGLTKAESIWAVYHED